MDKQKREIFLIVAGVVLGLILVIFSVSEIRFIAGQLIGSLNPSPAESGTVEFDIKRFEELQLTPPFNPQI
jgi:hypothetical protein